MVGPGAAVYQPFMRMKLSVIICCYNEIATIQDVIARTQAVDLGNGWTREIIVVDYCSTDGTRQLLQAIDDPEIRVIYHERNMGKGMSIRTGINNISGDYLIIQDADKEYDPAEHPKFCRKVEETGATAVYGSRILGGDVKYAWVGIDLAMASGEEIVVQGNVALDPNGEVLQDTANFMLRPFDERSSDYDSPSEWSAVVDKLLSDYPQLEKVLLAQSLTPDWIERVHSSIDRADYDRGDGTFLITEARERLDIMNGNDWNLPGHIRIEISDVGYQIYIRDDSGDNQLVGGEQTAPIKDSGFAKAAFGLNTNQLIENWFELFDTQIMESFMDYSLPEDGTLSGSMETSLLPDLASLKITDVDMNGQAETVIIDSNGQAVFTFNDSWVDRDAKDNSEDPSRSAPGSAAVIPRLSPRTNPCGLTASSAGV